MIDIFEEPPEGKRTKWVLIEAVHKEKIYRVRAKWFQTQQMYRVYTKDRKKCDFPTRTAIRIWTRFLPEPETGIYEMFPGGHGGFDEAFWGNT